MAREDLSPMPDAGSRGIASIAASPGALRLFGTSLVARLPLAMFSLALLVHAKHLTGSFAAAGIVTSAYAVAEGAGGPLLGRLVDRRGQQPVLLASASMSALLLCAAAVMPSGVPVSALVALAIGIGLATPPVGACTRALLPDVLRDASSLRAAYAFESSALELTFVAAPPLALGLGALWSTGAALAFGGIVLLLATAAFARQPVSRSWRPAPRVQSRGGSLQSPAIRTLVIVLLAVGVVFGAVEVGVTAAAAGLGSTAAAGPLLAAWGVGSLIGGIVASRLGGGARTATGLAIVLAALAAGHLSLAAASGSLIALAGVLVVAGAAIAPTYATVYAMVDEAAPAGTVTEAFAWLATATAIGASLGVAGAGVVAESAGPAVVFACAGAAGGLAVLVLVLRSRTLAGRGGTAPVLVSVAIVRDDQISAATA